MTRQIILAGAQGTAADAFAAFYQLEELRRVRDHTFRAIDALVLPTAPTIYTVEEVLADPIPLNSRLGTYTNFVNLLDLCGLAVPASMRPDGIAVRRDAAGAGRRGRHARLDRPAIPSTQPACRSARSSSRSRRSRNSRLRRQRAKSRIAVVGAHLSGMPLNGELRSAGGRLLERTKTAPHYRLYALAGTKPPKPGLLRVKNGAGAAIESKSGRCRTPAFGRFVAAVPPPLSIGTLELADGSAVKGFLVEAEAVAGARDISSFGGWRALWHFVGASIMLTCAATTRQPSGNRHPGLHLAADFAGHRRAVKQRRSHRMIAAIGADDGLRQSARRDRPASARHGTP